ncbi:hypothetical protein C0989_003814 [Termitomyces sp. Mn162]|nr:hypothetical protein C0989_003814 [Termitomyces sp. Mn162]
MAVLSSPLVLLQSIPPVTRIFTAATIISSSFYGWSYWKGWEADVADWLLVVPGTALFHPWTLVTSMFVETSVWEFIGTMIFVPASLKYLERLWGSLETLKFIVVSVAFSNIIAFALNWIEFVATRNADLFLYGMEYHGQMALQIAILVAFTQLIPEHQVQVFGFIKARVKASSARGSSFNSGGSSAGKPLTHLGNFVYNLATRFHLIPTSTGDVEIGSYNQVPGSARAEAERRRALALKALDQRLANSASPVGGSSSTPIHAPRIPPQAATGPPKPLNIERQKTAGSDASEKGQAGENQ